MNDKKEITPNLKKESKSTGLIIILILLIIALLSLGGYGYYKNIGNNDNNNQKILDEGIFYVNYDCNNLINYLTTNLNNPKSINSTTYEDLELSLKSSIINNKLVITVKENNIEVTGIDGIPSIIASINGRYLLVITKEGNLYYYFINYEEDGTGNYVISDTTIEFKKYNLNGITFTGITDLIEYERHSSEYFTNSNHYLIDSNNKLYAFTIDIDKKTLNVNLFNSNNYEYQMDKLTLKSDYSLSSFSLIEGTEYLLYIDELNQIKAYQVLLKRSEDSESDTKYFIIGKDDFVYLYDTENTNVSSNKIILEKISDKKFKSLKYNDSAYDENISTTNSNNIFDNVKIIFEDDSEILLSTIE